MTKIHYITLYNLSNFYSVIIILIKRRFAIFLTWHVRSVSINYNIDIRRKKKLFKIFSLIYRTATIYEKNDARF